MGMILDGRNYGGIMFNESSFSYDNPLSTYDYSNDEYITEDAVDAWERNLDRNIDDVMIEFRQTDMYKKATKNMSAKERDQFDKNLKAKVKSKIYEKEELVDRIFTAFALVGLIVIIAGLFITCVAPMVGATVMMAGWGLYLFTFIAICVRYICGGANVSKSDIKKILSEVLEE